MKKITLILALAFSVCAVTKAQQHNMPAKEVASPVQPNLALQRDKIFLAGNEPAGENIPPKDFDYYNRKSRNQRITGLSLLGGGLLLGGAGILSANSVSSNYDSNGETSAALFIVSAAAGFASIPFMILAHVNKSKARATLSTQKTFIPGKADKNITGLTISIPIGK